MALSPVLPKSYNGALKDVEQLVFVKTNIGGYFFDAVLRSEHTTSLTITDHPVEIGAAISDHSFVNPSILVMEVGMSDVAKSLVKGQFAGGWSRSVTAYKVLLELQKSRIPFQVLTRLNLYKNMLIETMIVPDDKETLYGLKATVTMREIFVATVKTVKISERPQTTDSTQRGEVQAITTDDSILKQLFK